MDRDIKFLHAFNTIRGVGPATLHSLKTHFGSFEAAWQADDHKLAISGIRNTELGAIVQKRSSMQPDREMEQLIRSGVWCITPENHEYPERLKEIPNPPMILYGRGVIPDCTFAIAVVGTRKPSLYGLEATEEIVRGLAQAGIVVVSGLALGIDTRAHHAALEAHGKTIAIVGSGIDRESMYPQENYNLASRITDAGGGGAERIRLRHPRPERTFSSTKPYYLRYLTRNACGRGA